MNSRDALALLVTYLPLFLENLGKVTLGYGRLSVFPLSCVGSCGEYGWMDGCWNWVPKSI